MPDLKSRGPIAAALAVCLYAGAFHPASAQDQNMNFNGVSRHYILHAPAGIEKPPVVFILHGSAMSGKQMQDITKMDAVADREKFLVVYPDGVNNSFKTSGPTDFEFFLAILDTLDAKYRIDRNRVYAAGFSQGGVMSYHIACRYADKFAAVAPVSGRIQETCTPKRPIPLLAIFGTKDVLSPDAFMKDMASIADFNGCPKTPAVTARPYPADNANSTVTHMEFGPCKEGVAVWADSVRGGPHEWPMDTRTKMNASEEVWGFFKKWTLAGPVTDAGYSRSPEKQGGIRATLAGGRLGLLGVVPGMRIRVFDLHGRLVLARMASQSAHSGTDAGGGSMDLGEIPAGVFLLKADGPGRSESLRVARR